MYFLYLPYSLPSIGAPSSISSPLPLISYSPAQPHYSCSLSSSQQSGRLTQNDRAFCHGVWNAPNITCQLRDDNGWHRAEGTRAKRDFSLLPSLFKSHYRQAEVLLSWLEVNDCLTLCSEYFPFLHEAGIHHGGGGH